MSSSESISPTTINGVAVILAVSFIVGLMEIDYRVDDFMDELTIHGADGVSRESSQDPIQTLYAVSTGRNEAQATPDRFLSLFDGESDEPSNEPSDKLRNQVLESDFELPDDPGVQWSEGQDKDQQSESDESFEIDPHPEPPTDIRQYFHVQVISKNGAIINGSFIEIGEAIDGIHQLSDQVRLVDLNRDRATLSYNNIYYDVYL